MAELVPPQLNASFETEFSIDRESDPPILGIKASETINRSLITQDRVGSTSFSAVLNRVQYGSYHGEPTCLIVVDFTFRFIPKVPSRYSYAYIQTCFRRAVDAQNHKIHPKDPSDDPRVINFAPKAVYGVIKTIENRRIKDVTVPVTFETPLGLSTGAKVDAGMKHTEHEDNRMEIHGQLYQDDDHIDGAHGVSWDLTENEAQADGILRNFRVAILIQNPPDKPMWMDIVVKPAVKFSADPRRLIAKNTEFARLLQMNDVPVLLDGKTARNGEPMIQCDDFTSPDFPWSEVLRMPGENQVGHFLSDTIAKL